VGSGIRPDKAANSSKCLDAQRVLRDDEDDLETPCHLEIPFARAHPGTHSKSVGMVFWSAYGNSWSSLPGAGMISGKN
jgi:hypothetical protein